MRFYHCLNVSVLLLIYLLGDNVLGAPTGEPTLMWLKCKNGTCIQKSTSPNQLFPDRETQELGQVRDSQESSESSEEQSGEGSGLGFPFLLPDGAQKEKGNQLDDWQLEAEQNVEESSGEINFGNDIIPEKRRLSPQDLELDNVIQ